MRVTTEELVELKSTKRKEGRQFFQPHLRFSNKIMNLSRALLNPKTLMELQTSPQTFKFRGDVMLRVGSETSAYVSVVKDPTTKTGLNLEGPLYYLIEFLAESMNFSYTVLQSPDRSFGAKLPNGSWTGLMGLVVREDVDIGLGPLMMSESRAEAVDFADTVTVMQLRVLAGRGSPELNPWGFIYPLNPLVWAGLLAALVGVWVVSLGLMREQWRSRGWNRVLWMLHVYLRVLLRQDLPQWITRGREMLVVGSWMLLSMILTMGYSSTLVSMLAARDIPQPINSLRDLVDSDSIVVMKPSSAFTDFFEAVRFATPITEIRVQFRKLDHCLHQEGHPNAEEGVYKEVGDLRYVGRVTYAVHQEHGKILNSLVRGGLHTFIEADYNNYKLMSDDFSRTERCDFYQSRDTFLASPMSLVVPRGNAILSAINHRINTLHAAGLINYWMEKTISNISFCRSAPSTVTVMESLSLRASWGMFTVWASGLLLSFVIFCLEIVTSNVENRVAK